ncbi:MAG: DUF1573 domain-containing protein [Cyclobacteriaceae bacterium]|nr:DUF1573 domain-containing protein [Cyclobacteriaceae bacterium]
MKLSALFVLWIVPLAAWGQLAEPVFFKAKTYDFGEVVESGGNVDYEFTFTNLGSRPIRVLSVNPSCGCTTPGWTKEPVAAGGTGFIKVSFDPKGKPGYFSKTLTVTSDADKNPVILTIKGNVVDKKSGGDELKVALGNLRMKSASFTLGKVYVNKPAVTHEFKIQNAGKQELQIKHVKTPDHIKIEAPKVLKPDEIASLQLMYDAALLNKYGFMADRVELVTNEPDSIKVVSVYATIEEFFPTLTATEMLKAPALAASGYALDFGRVKAGAKPELTVTIQNKGKQPLQIRELQPNCTCLSALVDKEILQPNETATLKLTLVTEGRAGTQNKSVTIYSTDPRNPVQRITVSGFIEKE